MKSLLASLCFCLSILSAHAETVTVGNAAPVMLPNGRSGSTSIAVKQTVHQLNFTLSAPKTVMIFTTADLNMSACSSSSRCVFGLTVAGNQSLAVINTATNTQIFEEIFKYSLTSTVLYPAGTREQDQLGVSPGTNQTSTLHSVINLPAGSYRLLLQVRNDFAPMSIHPKRLTVMY